jgi:uncharacterized spore protein YtfJ
MQKNTQKLESVISNQISVLGDMLSPDMVIGKQIKISNDITVIPVNKITLGYLNGGGEYGDIKLFSKEKKHPFLGGGGAVVNMSPNGFLIVKGNDVSYVKVLEDFIEGVFEKTTQFIQKNVYDKN